MRTMVEFPNLSNVPDPDDARYILPHGVLCENCDGYGWNWSDINDGKTESCNVCVNTGRETVPFSEVEQGGIK